MRPWHNAAEDYEPKVDVSYTMGKHAMKYGFSYNRYTKNQQVTGLHKVISRSAVDLMASSPAASPIATAPRRRMWLPPHAFRRRLNGHAAGHASSYDQQASAPINHYVNQTPSST